MNDYYVYLYLNPLKQGIFKYGDLVFDFEPFYIGKGKSYRLNHHMNNCFNIKDKKGYRRLFYQKLRKIIRSGNKPIIKKYKIGLTEISAFDLEKELIKTIGRRIYKEGPLCNNSIGGEGSSGCNHSLYMVCVYDNNGNLISKEKNVEECSKRYRISKMTIYKHCLGHKKNPTRGLRYRKETEKLEKLEKAIFTQKGKPKGYKHKTISPLSKTVYQYDLNDNFIKEYPNTLIASKELNLLSTCIYNNLSGKSKTCKRKFKFKYNKI